MLFIIIYIFFFIYDVFDKLIFHQQFKFQKEICSSVTKPVSPLGLTDEEVISVFSTLKKNKLPP